MMMRWAGWCSLDGTSGGANGDVVGSNGCTVACISCGRVEGVECVVGVECSSPQQVVILSEISSGVHMAHVEELSAQYD